MPPAASVGIRIDWGVVAICVILGAGALAAVRRGFSSREALNERFKGQQAQARAGLEANHVLPRLTQLVMDVTLPLPADTFVERTDEDIAGLVASQLRATGFRPQLTELQRLASDDTSIDSHYNRAHTFGRGKAWSGVGFFPGLLVVGTDIALDGFELEPALVICGWVALGLATLALGVFWSFETHEKNALVSVCERYE